MQSWQPDVVVLIATAHYHCFRSACSSLGLALHNHLVVHHEDCVRQEDNPPQEPVAALGEGDLEGLAVLEIAARALPLLVAMLLLTAVRYHALPCPFALAMSCVLQGIHIKFTLKLYICIACSA